MLPVLVKLGLYNRKKLKCKTVAAVTINQVNVTSISYGVTGLSAFIRHALNLKYAKPGPNLTRVNRSSFIRVIWHPITNCCDVKTVFFYQQGGKW